MSWYIKKIGTRKAVKDSIQKDLEQLKQQECPVDFIKSCVDRLPAYQGSITNGVYVEGSGHGGGIANLKIEDIVLCEESPCDVPAVVAVESEAGK